MSACRVFEGRVMRIVLLVFNYSGLQSCQGGVLLGFMLISNFKAP